MARQFVCATVGLCATCSSGRETQPKPLTEMSSPEPTHPGAVAPERARDLEIGPLRLRLHEWGDPRAEPLVLAHGMWDHARGFDVLAPLLAQRYRVIAVDARGHGDSSWADGYRWWDDVVDLCCVLRSVGRACQLVGHSKGGAQATETACAMPELVRKLVNIDGFGPPLPGERTPPEPERPLLQEFAQFLDRQRAQRPYRPATSLDELCERRRRTNQRLPEPWLHYFVFHGARRVGEGWTWKSDPRVGDSFGPWKPEWIAPTLQQLRVPLLAIVGSEPDFYGPASDAQLDVRLAYARDAVRVRIPGAGHFVHMEQPEQTARVILDFLTS